MQSQGPPDCHSVDAMLHVMPVWAEREGCTNAQPVIGQATW